MDGRLETSDQQGVPMQMKVYSRGDEHLVVFPELPQWAIVDRRALELLNAIATTDLAPDEAFKRLPADRRRKDRALYNELLPLITPSSDAGAPIERTLTSHTTVAMIGVTERCNLRCPHCYVDACRAAQRELTLAEHGRLATDICRVLASRSDTTCRINLTGGEPFCRKDILEIIETYRNVGLGVTMSTNGLLITKKQAAALATYGVIPSISIDGATAETHDAIRGPGTFVRTCAVIRMLGDAGIRVGVNHLVHDGNVHELERVISLVYELGCSGFNPINLVQLGRACDSPLRRASETDVFRRLAAHIAATPEHARLFDRTSMFSSIGAALLAGITCVSCGVGNRPCVYVTATGDVYPCPNTQWPEFLLGNVRNGDFETTVRTNSPILQRLRGLTVESLNPTCSGCDVRRFCGGDCRGETYSVTHDLCAPYVACEDRHDSIVEMMWVVAQQPELFEGRAREFIANASVHA